MYKKAFRRQNSRDWQHFTCSNTLHLQRKSLAAPLSDLPAACVASSNCFSFQQTLKMQSVFASLINAFLNLITLLLLYANAVGELKNTT